MNFYSPQSNRGHQRQLAVAVLAFLALLGTACGSSSTATAVQPTDDSIVDPLNPNPLSPVEPFNPLDPNAPPHTIDVEYGATLEEWTAAGSDGEPLPVPWGEDSSYTHLEWTDLVPEGFSSDEIWAKYTDQFLELEFGTPEEQALYDKVLAEIDPNVIDPALDGKEIRMTGFVAPLAYDGDIVTEFLLVPYFGACIHVPPPPANQTVLVTVDKDSGFTTDDTWGTVWVEGTMKIESSTTDLASAGYAITGVNAGVYQNY